MNREALRKRNEQHALAAAEAVHKDRLERGWEARTVDERRARMTDLAVLDGAAEMLPYTEYKSYDIVINGNDTSGRFTMRLDEEGREHVEEALGRAFEIMKFEKAGIIIQPTD